MSNDYQPKYLHIIHPGFYYLDHKLTPEVRAMFCAMTSRMPAGGIQARYMEVVEEVAESLYEQWTPDIVGEPGDRIPWNHIPWSVKEGTGNLRDLYERFVEQAEDALTEYPLHPVVQAFFDKWVGKYGHSSIVEQTGSPTVFFEGISWWTAYMLFDSPLVCGQEFSTRAVRRADWPMARECYSEDTVATSILQAEDDRAIQFLTGDPKATCKSTPPVLVAHPLLAELHKEWLTIFEAEVEAWKVELRKPCEVCDGAGVVPDVEDHGSPTPCSACSGTGVLYPEMATDKQGMRPALDRARWAIPGTIATGVSFSSHLRERVRCLKDALGMAIESNALGAVDTIVKMLDTYCAAVPGIADQVIGKLPDDAGYESNYMKVPSHLAPEARLEYAPVYPGAIGVGPIQHSMLHLISNWCPSFRKSRREYADPVLNNIRVPFTIHCSVAVLRDWHRHRTMYPMRFTFCRNEDALVLHPTYAPLSEVALDNIERLMVRSKEVYEELRTEAPYLAPLALPFGAMVRIDAEAGLRDFLYCMELRYHNPGANFEYKEQAKSALEALRHALDGYPRIIAATIGTEGE